MTKTVWQMQSSMIQLRDQIEYPEAGILSKVLLKDNCCQYTLFCLAAGTEISEHTATRNATVHVLAGQGQLTLEGQAIAKRTRYICGHACSCTPCPQRRREFGIFTHSVRTTSTSAIAGKHCVTSPDVDATHTTRASIPHDTVFLERLDTPRRL
jgi:hypothetical protein